MGIYAVKKGKLLLFTLFLLLIGVVLVAFSDTARAGAKEGLVLCSEVVIPALFAFMCLCEWFSLSGAAERLTQALQPVFRLLMGRCYGGGTALVMCLLGGYPMGAAALTRLKERGVLDEQTVTDLSLLLFAPSPAFVITGVGMGLLGSMKAGVLLWGACGLSAVVIAAVGSRFFRPLEVSVACQNQPLPSGEAFVKAVQDACSKMLHICAMVVVFRVMASLMLLLPLPCELTPYLVAAGEVTNGCKVMAGQSLPAMAAMITFGGVCTHMQIKGILGSQMPKYTRYLWVRLMQSAISYGLAAVLCRLFPSAAAVMANGQPPVQGEVSLLPSVALLVTCVVFLSSLNIGMEKRRKNHEESGIYPC